MYLVEENIFSPICLLFLENWCAYRWSQTCAAELRSGAYSSGGSNEEFAKRCSAVRLGRRAIQITGRLCNTLTLDTHLVSSICGLKLHLESDLVNILVELFKGVVE